MTNRGSTAFDRGAVIAALREALGAASDGSEDSGIGPVVTDEDRLASLGVDASGEGRGSALALVRPASTAQVQAVVLIAAAHRAPIVAQGSRTSLAGAASAVAGAILVDFSRMNRILRIDPLERLAVVQPGVLVAELAAAAEAEGLFYAPDPVSAQWASIGGTIATNAGGMRCIKYGVTRDSVRSLEVVLADGSVVRGASVCGSDSYSSVVRSCGSSSSGRSAWIRCVRSWCSTYGSRASRRLAARPVACACDPGGLLASTLRRSVRTRGVWSSSADGAEVITPTLSLKGSGSSARFVSNAVTAPVRTSAMRPFSSIRAKSIGAPTFGSSTRQPGTCASRVATYWAPTQRAAFFDASRRFEPGVITMRRQMPLPSRRNVQDAVCAAYMMSKLSATSTGPRAIRGPDIVRRCPTSPRAVSAGFRLLGRAR